MLTVLIIGLVLFLVFMLISFSSAPLGYEDENGFHYSDKKIETKEIKLERPAVNYINVFQKGVL